MKVLQKNFLLKEILIILILLFSPKLLAKEKDLNKDFEHTLSLLTKAERYLLDIAPHYHHKGYEMSKLPKDLKERLVKLWSDKQSFAKKEYDKERISTNENFNSKIEKILNLIGLGSSPSKLLRIQDYDYNLSKDLENYLKEVLEKWSNTKNLQHTSTYGIREYQKGAVLKPHIDRFRTHVISAIIYIGQRVNEPWPLIVWDHNKKPHEIYFDDEHDLVFYESTTVIHGRPIPFNGSSYINLYVHFKTTEWDDKVANKVKELNKKLGVINHR